MCWSNVIAIPIVLKKPLKVYKTGISMVSDSFISLYQNFIYSKSQTMPTVKINPKFKRSYSSRWFSMALWNYDTFYIDKVTYLKVTINDNSYFKYTVTKVTPNGKNGKSVGIYQFSSDNIDFLRYYKMCSKSEWSSALDRLNIWLKDANLKVGEL